MIKKRLENISLSVLVFNFKSFPSDSGHEIRVGSDQDVNEIAINAFKNIDHDMIVYR